MKTLRNVLCLLVALGAAGGVAHANDIYIGQNLVGVGNGSSCANAYAYSFFNTAANWGAGSNQIGPGTTVHICGTITDIPNGTLLTAQGSGASGNPVTIKLELNASLQSPGENQFINGNGQSHFVVTGTTPCGWINLARTTCTESIYNTLNGFSGQSCPGGSCAYQVQTTVIGNFTGDLTVENLTIGPIYIHGGTSDTTFSAPGPVGISFTGSAAMLNVNHVILHDGGWCMNAIAPSTTVANVEIYHCDHGDGGGQYTDSANTVSNLTFHDIYIHDPYVWDQANNAFHHDGIHIFSYCGTLVGGNNTYCPNTIITGVNVYNVWCGGNWGSNNTACLFFEGNIANANLFNNVSTVTTGQLNNGLWNGYGSNVNFFNNTVLGPGSSMQTIKWSIFDGPGQVIVNNAFTDGGMISSNGPFPLNCPYTAPGSQGNVSCVNLSYTFKNNAYMAPADFGNGFGYTNCTGASCAGNGFLNFSASGFASFESNASESNGVFNDTTEPNGTWFNTLTGSELSGSPTISAGLNLTSLCTGLAIAGNPCLYDIAGSARPSSGAWDIGAYQSGGGSSGGGTTVVAPTALTATVH